MPVWAISGLPNTGQWWEGLGHGDKDLEYCVMRQGVSPTCVWPERLERLTSKLSTGL